MDVVSLIFDKAVQLCPMYAQLCSEHTSDEPGGLKITFKRFLLNKCQMVFEGADKLREEVRQMTAPEQGSERIDKERLYSLGNIRLIGELLNENMVTEDICHLIVQELLGPNNKTYPVEDNVNLRVSL